MFGGQRYNRDMKATCKACQYFRDPGQMDVGIPGHGHWCSNSQSKMFRLRVLAVNGCDQFQARGKKAGLVMRLKVKGLWLVNKVLRRKR